MTFAEKAIRVSASLPSAFAILFLGGVAGAGPAQAEAGLADFFEPILDARLRYEAVDQDGVSENADAVTLRARAGFKTKPVHGVSALVEMEAVQALVNDYNSTVNGRTQFPVVADPEGAELNRAQISYADDHVKAVLGRQRIIFDNARFVGNVGWRQNEQTFDAALATVKPFKGLSLTYSYVDAVQRIFGNKSAIGDFNSDSHLINLSYSGIDNLKVTAYAYVLDLIEAPVLSTATYGIRAAGSVQLTEKIPLKLVGEFANQSDHGGNARDIDLNYYMGSVGTKIGGFDASVSYELLEGDGTTGFSTPLATLHKFQGWADVFLATPASGIQDLYGRIGYATGPVGPFKKIVAAAIYHDFERDTGSGSLGDELDLLLKAVLTKQVAVTLKYATYDGPSGGPASRDKAWFQVDFKL